MITDTKMNIDQDPDSEKTSSHRHPRLYREDRRGDRRRGDDDRRRDYNHHDHDDSRRRYDDRHRERDRDRDRDRDRQGRQANGASPRHSADNHSRSPVGPRKSIPTTSRTVSPAGEVFHAPNETKLQTVELTEAQRARREKAEAWKKKKAAEAAAKSALSTNETATNHSSPTVDGSKSTTTKGTSSFYTFPP